MVDLSIRNEDNIWDKVIGISFRRKDHLSADVILNVWEKVTQPKSRLNASEKLILKFHSVKMPVSFGRDMETKGRPLDNLAHLKKSIMRVKSETNCLAYA